MTEDVMKTEGHRWSVEITHPANACAYIKDADGNEMACLYGGGEGEKIGEVWHHQHKRDANAHLIVTAVNERSALLKCEEALREIAELDENRFAPSIWSIIDSARAALTLLDEARK